MSGRVFVAAVFLTVATMTGPSAADCVPPCPEEDSVGPCFWDAQERGNGRGLSFTVDSDGTVTYGDRVRECAE
jgi:hypothetical protein